MSRRVFNTVTVVDRPDGRRYRGCQAWGVSAASLTLRVQLESHTAGTRVVSRSLAPQAILGDALAAEVTSGTGADSYTFGALYPARFASLDGSNDSVARGEFCPGHIDPSLSGDPGYVPWYAGMLNERSSPWWTR